jgi:GH18 family chitinase
MKELGDSCHVDAKYYLSAAITAGKYAGAYRDAITAELLQGDKVDFYNIMAYDDFSTTAPFRHHSDMNLAQTSLNYWINTRGMPKKRAILGLPVYGRPSGITQTNTTLTYSAILTQGGSPLSDSATVSVTGFPNYTIYYNGQPTVKKKTMLAKSMANGIMWWEKGQDANDATSLLKAACDTLGRLY